MKEKKTKWQIAVMIERLPHNDSWSAERCATAFYKHLSRAELVGWYNRVVEERHLDLPTIL